MDNMKRTMKTYWKYTNKYDKNTCRENEVFAKIDDSYDDLYKKIIKYCDTMYKKKQKQKRKQWN